MGPGIIEIFKLYYPIFLKGAVGTLKYAAIAVGFGSILGTIIGFIHLSKNPVLKAVASLYSTVIRGTPLLVQMYIGYYFIPMAIPALNALSREHCVVLTMILNSSAYVSEIIRAGILSINKGQTEAGRSLGLNAKQTMLYIIIPQAVKNIFPAMGNEFITLIKETAIVGYVGLMDIQKAGDFIKSATYEAFMPLVGTAVIYFILIRLLTAALGRYEAKLRRSG